jgi:hypothetical protein
LNLKKSKPGKVQSSRFFARITKSPMTFKNNKPVQHAASSFVIAAYPKVRLMETGCARLSFGTAKPRK